MTIMLELNNIYRSYRIGKENLDVLKGISLSLYAGEMIAIVGASGSGKSTLMNIIGCLDKPSNGTYNIAGIDISTLSRPVLANLRREYFGFIFQRYHLISYLTALQNIEVPALYAGIEKKKRVERAQLLLSLLDMSERADYLPSQLSGGQQQRVSIARAIMNRGQIILADEPTGALDSHSGKEVMSILHKLNNQGHMIIIVTHDRQIANQAGRIIEIHDGQLVNKQNYIDFYVQTREKSQKKLVLKSIFSWKQLINCLYEALKIAWLSMMANKMRTFLTTLGIIIGIASVVSIIVIGDAAKHLVLKDIRAIGANTIDIYPGRDLNDETPHYQQALKYDDLISIKKQFWVDSATPTVFQNLRLYSNNVNVAASISGVSENYFNVYGMTFSEGTAFNIEQLNRRSQVIILDNNTRRQLFPNKISVVGEVVLAGNVPLIVIGVIQEKSLALNNGNILHAWLPYTTISEKIIGQSWLNSITVKVKEGYDSAQAAKQLERLLILRHEKKDFFIRNIDGILKTVEKTTLIFQLMLTLIAVISLVVGGVGVMNIMLVSVTERTQEIGIRIAVGARTSDVLQQFLIESVLVCLIGGAIGIVISILIAFILHLFLSDWEIGFSLTALLIALLCSTFTGILFGWLPARSAADLDPVNALSRD